MSIVKMKRLTAIASRQARRQVLLNLHRLECVEIEESEPSDQLRLQRLSEDTGSQQSRASLARALGLLNQVAPFKKPMLSAKREVSESLLFDGRRLDGALKLAEEIDALYTRREDTKNQISRYETHIKMMAPWIECELPLNTTGTRGAPLLFGTMSSSSNIELAVKALEESGAAFDLSRVSTDSDLHYVTLMYFRGDEDTVMTALKPFGFSRVVFKDITRSAKGETDGAGRQITALQKDMAVALGQIAAFAPQRELLEEALDAYTQEAARDDVLSRVGYTDKTVVFTGWVPAETEPRVAAVLEKNGCAYSFDDPVEGDNPPTAMKNGKLAHPFGAVTEMYGLPGYNSIVDPNPLIMPFYIVFFGFIMADAGYGLLMALGSLLALKKMKPRGTSHQMFTMFFYCGIFTIIAGILTGGFFADAVGAFCKTFLHSDFTIKPVWFDPLNEPMTFLIVSIVFGAIQILFGMGVSAYRTIKRGDIIGAIGEVGTWYIIFIGLALAVLGVGIGVYLCILGVVLMIVIGGRGKKGIGRLTGGLGQLYGVTGIVSDLLSYSRIMALALSGAVVGKVMNQIGTMVGGFVGIFVFIIAFVIGHGFNIAISGLGAYVHTNRLQYIEFFGRFYEGGGRSFKPLVNKTKYIDIVREEN